MAGWVELPPAAHDGVQAAVWDLYVRTYASIGLIIDDPSDLDEYDVWKVYFDDEGRVRAFALGKTTRYGVKRGLSGSDGSDVGKRAVKAELAAALHQPGVYGEVSHAVEHLALKAGAPVVCSSDAAIVLGKQIRPLPDGIHYERLLAVGPVVKLMVGRPLNVRTTSHKAPRCTVEQQPLAGWRWRRSRALGDAETDMVEHLSNLIF